MRIRNLNIIDRIFSNPDQSLGFSIIISLIVHLAVFGALLVRVSFNHGNSQIILDSQRSNITLINYSSQYIKPENTTSKESIKTDRGDIPVISDRKKIKRGEDAANASFSAEGLAAKETYETEILKRIHRMKYYPQYARKMGNEGAVYLKFTLAKDGSLKEPVKITGKCDYDILNNAAVSTIKQAGPFPPFPDNLSKEKESITFNVELEYNLRIPEES